MEDGIFLKELGSKIRATRKARNLTLTHVSEATKIDRCNLTHLELRGKNAHILTIKAIADCLGVPMEELLNLHHGKE